MLRTPEALIPWLLAAACVAAGGMWRVADHLSARGAVTTSGTAQVGGPFRLVDQNSRVRSDAEFRGRWMLVYFGYTNCPDVCPTTLALMADVLKQLGGRANRIAPIFITLDLAHDTPHILKLYLNSFDPRFIGLTGSEQQITKVAKEYRVYRVKRPLKGGGYAIDHSSVICLMDPAGKFAAVYDNSQTPEQITSDLKKRL
jgi:cytochrome oxidase Cu insertion factor (SCO1/SenC/PrrC family)